MTSPRRANPIRLPCVQKRKLSLRDHGHQSSVLYLQNEPETQHWVHQINPADSATEGQKSCDWLVEIYAGATTQSEVLEQVYVELKRKNDLETAIEQLSKTILRFDPHRQHRKRSYAVGRFSKPQQQRFRLKDKEFLKKYRSHFWVVSGGVTEPLHTQSTW